MKKTRILFLIAIIIGYFFVSCSEDEKVERPYMYRFSESSLTVYDNLPEVALEVMYDGPHQSTAIDILVEVDDTLSSAVEGVDFNLASTSVQIPANSSFSTLNFSTLQMASGDVKKLVLNLIEGEFEISSLSQNKHTVTIKGPVVEFDEGDAEAYDTIADPSISAAINLLGTPRGVAQSIGFEIIDTAATTAVAGVHYNMVSLGTDVTLAANTDETAIAFDVIPGCMTTAIEDVELVFNINRPGDLVSTEDSVYTFTFLAPRIEFVKTDSIVDNNAGNIDIELELVGPAANVARTITFEVDSKSTAFVGQQYNVVTASPVTILANEKKGILTLNVLDGLTIIHQDVKVILKLTTDGDFGVGDEDTFTLTIEAPE